MRASVAERQASALDSREWISLTAIVAFSLLLKWAAWAVLLETPDRFLDPDSATYHSSALSLLDLRAFTPNPEIPDVPETGRTPGYPLFLASTYSLLGESHAAAIFVQTVLSVGTIVLVYWMARRLGSTRVALVAALLASLDVASFTYSLKLMSDTLFTLLVTAMLAAGVVLLTSDRKGPSALTLGVLLTLATLVRPISYYLIVPLVGCILASAILRRWSWRVSILVVLAICVPYLVGVGGWQVRNYLLTGSKQFSALEGFNLLYYRGAAVVAQRDGTSLRRARADLGLEEGHREYHLDTGWTPSQDEEWRKQAVDLILEHPLLFVQSQVRGGILLMLAPGEGPLLRMAGVRLERSGYWSRYRVPAAAIASLFALLYLATVYTGLGSWLWNQLSSRGIGSVDLFLWTVLLYFVVTSAGQGYSRFRLPLMPILVLYSGRGLVQLWARLRGPT